MRQTNITQTKGNQDNILRSSLADDNQIIESDIFENPENIQKDSLAYKQQLLALEQFEK